MFKPRKLSYAIVLLLAACICTNGHAEQGRLKGTGGVSSLSGAGGGGLIPWATLSTLASAEQFGAVAFTTRIDVDHFQLDVSGLSINLHNRLELSLAKQTFTIKASHKQIEQNVTGLKLRLSGDLLFGKTPQVSLGLERHSLLDPATAFAVGAKNDNGTDIYLSAARAWINGPFNRTTMINVNARYSDANQYGILGHGGDDKDSGVSLEVATAIFIKRNWVIGAEYREKPDNLSALREENATDVFIAWLPNKHWSLTAAYVSLGAIAGARDQNGYYFSLQGAF